MLKPTELGVSGVKRPISQHRQIVENALKRLLRIKGPQARVANVCLQIMQVPNGGIIDIEGLTLSELSEIKNYFSEVMGPIWCYEQGLIPGVKLHDHTYFESVQGRLYDFKVYREDEVFLISNKRRNGVSNTLKPADVIRLIDTNEDLSSWRTTDQYRVMRILDDNNVVSGPIKVIARVYPNLVSVSSSDFDQVIRQLTRNEVVLDEVPDSIMELIQNDPTASAQYEERQVVTGTMINFIFEKLLIEQSKNDPLFNEMYVEATESKVMFLKFDLDRKGNVYFRIEPPRESSKLAIFRSKQGIERRDWSGKLKLDKLGLTV